MRSVLCLVLCLLPMALCLSPAAAAPPGLYLSRGGALMRAGKPYRGIGVNYFDCFARVLANPEDNSFREGFQALEQRGIPFARFMAGGFWPIENRLYTTDRERYFALMDRVVKAAEVSHVGLIPSLFWNLNTVPDLVGEPCDQWGNPQSKTIAWMREYTREVVTRYAKSPAIWGWEFGNEYNLGADLPNASEHRPATWPNLGTPASRSARDELTHDMIRTAFGEFAKEVRKHDPDRVVVSGNGFPRPSAWHQKAEKSWSQDTEEQYVEMLLGDNPDPMDTLCVHLYPGDEDRFGRKVSPAELLAVSMRAAKRARKPLFVGEFGASDEKGADSAKADFRRLLDAIVQAQVPLSALWVYDYGEQADAWSVKATNSRAYQLDAIAEANRRLAGGL